MRYRQNTEGDILYGPPVTCQGSLSVHWNQDWLHEQTCNH